MNRNSPKFVMNLITMAVHPMLLVSCLLINTMSASFITLNQGGYNDIVVAFSHQLPQPSNCSQFLHHFETVFHESSRQLYESTGRNVYFRSINVLVPPHWNLSGCSRSVSRSRLENYNDADFRIGTTHPLWGDSIWTQQSQDCFKPGDYISTTPTFFMKNADNSTDTHSLGRKLLREWAKYRYGIFDEIGYFQDAMYPTFYTHEMETTPTACTDGIIQGQKTDCDSNDQVCNFQPFGNNSHIHSSIMSYTQLPNVTDFCDSTTHNDLAPTKHNLLCEGRSTKDVIFNHSDFNNINSQPVNRTKTVFFYKQTSPPRYVLALDKGAAMDERDHWKFVRIVSRRFILNDLPDQAELGVLSFTDTVAVHDNITVLSNTGKREAVASSIPDFLTPASTTSSVQESCLLCAVREAITMLERNATSAAGDVIILITSGSTSADQIQSATALATLKKVHISVIAYAYASPITSLRNLQFLTEATGGYISTIASKGVGYMSHISMLIELGDALLSALHYHQKTDSVNLPVLIHEQEFGGSTSGWVNGSFILDPTLGRDTVLAVYFYSRDNTHVGDIRLIAPDGTEYRGKSEDSMASLYFTPLATIDKPGIWRYSFDRRSQSHQSHFVKVTSKLKLVSGKGTNRGALTASLKIVRPANSVYQPAPVILLATVKQGELPVLDARVRANIQFSSNSANNDINANNSMVIDLLDNGNGDPDITKGDGVYSRYFGKYFKGTGIYSISLSVDTMDGRAYSIRSLSPSTEYMECCGSVIEVPQERRELTGPFTRMTSGGIVVVTSPATTGQSFNSSWNSEQETDTDILPPSRITDLKVKVQASNQRITYYWTAVGEDFDIGTAYGYDMRISANRTDLKAGVFHLADSIPVTIMSQPSGTLMQFTTDFFQLDRSYYVAVRAVDRRGNQGRISNIVEIYIPSPPTTPAPSWPSTTFPNGEHWNSSSFSSEWFYGGLTTVHWAAIVAGGCVAILILILVIYFVIDAKRRKEKEVKTPPKFAYVPPVNSTLYTSEKEKPTEKEAITDFNNVPTIYDGKTVPVHWSASQLLQEHERRHSPYGHNEPDNYTSNEHYSPNGNFPHPYEYNISPDNINRHSTVFSGSYHLNTGSATYGNADETAINIYPVSGTSSVTPPSESFASLQLNDPHRGYRPYSVDYEGSSMENEAYFPQAKPRPPTLPKPDPSKAGPRLSNLPLQGSFTSLASERKKRNVTQV